MFVHFTNDTAPFDYAATTVDLTFNPSNFRRCVNIIIEDDNRIEEETEVFNVSLTTSDLAIDLDPFIAAIRVRDNDGKSAPIWGSLQVRRCFDFVTSSGRCVWI